MERLTERNFKIGFDDSDTLPSYVSIYEKLRQYENIEEDKEEKGMIIINKIEKDSEWRCTSCQKESRESGLYEIKICKTERQTVTVRLCFDCLTDFGNKAYGIYREETVFLDD